ncbi:histidine phosphatase family protein [Flavobacterium sp. H122]|uniref:SixA phosphatase family protein n=1 Tax=Flavobacterium sp. H122 TaxID=2529860 RepID=UPI0010AA9E29|nr:histidine phosphatase family protein [Flavobacterium sp. H122]
MKSLILVRHAKSSWEFSLEDKQRPLTETGIKAIKKVGKTAQNFVNEDFTIWSSTAKRAKETVLLFVENAHLKPDSINFIDNLYTFNESQLENEIKKCDNFVNKLILFGHNEAITNFVNKFGDEYIFNVPTAGLVFLQFETDNWENINKGKIIKKIFPKELD